MAIKDPSAVVLRGAKTWNAWRKKNAPYLRFQSPNWYRGPRIRGHQVKGTNRLNFEGIDLSGAEINHAFAEGLNVRGANFENTTFEEGDFSRANFSQATFRNTRFNKTILTDARFDGAVFVNCNLNRVNLAKASFNVREITETVVYGISAWDLQISDKTKQSRLIIEPTHSLYSEFMGRGVVPLMVDDIELAQFIYYLSNHKRMRAVINVLSDKAVLLLGRFANGGLEFLYKIRDVLKGHGYTPMIFDFARPDSLSLTETAVAMAALCKFIVVDLSGPSVPKELHAILSEIKRPVLAIGKKYALFDDTEDQTSVVSINFQTANTLSEMVKVLPKLEKLHAARVVQLAKRYSQRASNAR
jgi:hypothetical protein